MQGTSFGYLALSNHPFNPYSRVNGIRSVPFAADLFLAPLTSVHLSGLFLSSMQKVSLDLKRGRAEISPVNVRHWCYNRKNNSGLNKSDFNPTKGPLSQINNGKGVERLPFREVVGLDGNYKWPLLCHFVILKSYNTCPVCDK